MLLSGQSRVIFYRKLLNFIIFNFFGVLFNLPTTSSLSLEVTLSSAPSPNVTVQMYSLLSLTFRFVKERVLVLLAEMEIERRLFLI